jgi:hypothetical protein
MDLGRDGFAISISRRKLESCFNACAATCLPSPV